HHPISFVFFFQTHTNTDIYPLSLHDALPICSRASSTSPSSISGGENSSPSTSPFVSTSRMRSSDSTFTSPWATIKIALCSSWRGDRKSTRLNSSHVKISYAVFCLKKKK